MSAESGDWSVRKLTLLFTGDQLLEEVNREHLVVAEVGADLHAQEVEEVLLRAELGGELIDGHALWAALHVDVLFHNI